MNFRDESFPGCRDVTANVLDINEGGKPAAMLGLEKGRELFYSAAGWSSLVYQLESCTKWLLFNEVFSN